MNILTALYIMQTDIYNTYNMYQSSAHNCWNIILKDFNFFFKVLVSFTVLLYKHNYYGVGIFNFSIQEALK